MGLTTPLSSIPQIGPKHAALLLRINLNTVSDLLQYYPFRYQDYSQLSPVASLKVGDTVTLTGQVISIKNVRLKGGRTLQQAIFSDGQQTLPVSWFNQPYLIQTFTRQPQLSLSGKVVTYRGHLTLVSPQYESLKSEIATIHTGRLVPIYHEIQGLSSHWLRQRLKFILNHELDQMVDRLPQTILSLYQLIDL